MMNEFKTCAEAESKVVDLTSDEYWDYQWDRARQSTPRPYSLRSILNSLLGERMTPLHDFLGTEVDRLARKRENVRLRVLEVGCAPGSVLEGVMERCSQHQFFGVDFSVDGVRDTLARFRSLDCPPEIQQSDVREFQPAQLFDFVYSCGLIEHFTDPLPMLRDHLRLCAPGGKVVITVPNYSGSLQRFSMSRLDPEGWRSHNTSVMSQRALKELATLAGLRNVSTGGIGKHVLRAVCTVKSPANTLIQAAARTYSLGVRMVPGAIAGPHHFWMVGEV